MARGDLNASQAGPQSRGDALADRKVEAAIVRVLTNKFSLSERVVQQLQELAGDRGDTAAGRPRAAVRRQDLRAIARMSEMKSKQVSAAPTAADFNALRDDVRMVFEALRAIAQALGA
ncbi:hypothetical protein [Burkholderia mayonis]|uniref:Uncharacterized protein n=1 Tax=Burkholderia mayonis TaxID=1385591 RepID=A0A1B4G162_9BURK|nr:hypothetical protein [Burkholderia mayonis]AOJ09663.1 hypothetical protein WS71_20360 [Burkholderia mayonis]KVE52284.1 hypothetical protein WS71_10185 [Burkholderia mayonis]